MNPNSSIEALNLLSAENCKQKHFIALNLFKSKKMFFFKALSESPLTIVPSDLENVAQEVQTDVIPLINVVVESNNDGIVQLSTNVIPRANDNIRSKLVTFEATDPRPSSDTASSSNVNPTSILPELSEPKRTKPTPKKRGRPKRGVKRGRETNQLEENSQVAKRPRKRSVSRRGRGKKPTKK